MPSVTKAMSSHNLQGWSSTSNLTNHSRAKIKFVWLRLVWALSTKLIAICAVVWGMKHEGGWLCMIYHETERVRPPPPKMNRQAHFKPRTLSSLSINYRTAALPWQVIWTVRKEWWSVSLKREREWEIVWWGVVFWVACHIFKLAASSVLWCYSLADWALFRCSCALFTGHWSVFGVELKAN
jgi:hypothetical protein